jgi:hypothetical protein
VFYACALGLVCSPATAQTPPSGMPTHLTIARHTFFDFGPLHDFYEILDVAPNGHALSDQRALVTPPGAARQRLNYLPALSTRTWSSYF